MPPAPRTWIGILERSTQFILVPHALVDLLAGGLQCLAKNIALLHSAQGTALAPAYDIVPGLVARDMIDEGFRMAFAVNGTFDHRQMSVDALVAEAKSWRVTSPGLASSAVEDAIASCG